MTTSRFAEAKSRLADLLAKPEFEPKTRVALQALEIATLLAFNETVAVPAKLTALHEIVVVNPDQVVGGWNFTGTEHFISGQPALAAHPWLLELLTAIEGENSRVLLAAIEKGRAAVGLAGVPARDSTAGNH